MFSVDALNAELARRSLLTFAQRMEPGFEDPPHIRLLVNLLEQLESGAIRRACVSLPPRMGKTTLCSQLFPAWAIGRDPKRTVILGNHSSELAASFSRKAKGYIETPNWSFSKIALSEDSRAVHRWNVTPGGGGLFSVGVGSGITGIGADFLIIDDPINDALSETERNQAWDWYRTVAFPRCNAGARILVVSARLAMDDLPGRLMESDDADLWRFVSLPAINREGNELGLKPGEPLWERFGHEELSQRREAMGLAAYSAQFEQDPSVVAGGKLFRLEDFGEWSALPKAPERPWNPLDHLYQSPLDSARADDSTFVKITGCDFAGTENTSTGGSYSALVTVMLDLRNGEVFVLDCERYRNLEFLELRKRVLSHLTRNGPNLCVIEANDGTGGRMIGDLSRTAPYPIRPVKPKTSKMERALQVIGMVEGGKVFLPARSTFGDFLRSEISQFGPGCRYSDCVDALVWALLAARQYVAARREDQFYERQLEGFSLFG